MNLGFLILVLGIENVNVEMHYANNKQIVHSVMCLGANGFEFFLTEPMDSQKS